MRERWISYEQSRSQRVRGTSLRPEPLVCWFRDGLQTGIVLVTCRDLGLDYPDCGYNDCYYKVTCSPNTVLLKSHLVARVLHPLSTSRCKRDLRFNHHSKFKGPSPSLIMNQFIVLSAITH